MNSVGRNCVAVLTLNAQVVSIGMNMPVLVAANLGFGKDMWGIPPDNITESLKWLYVAYFMYMWAEALCQLSILAFYLRIMVEPRMRTIVWILIVFVTCFGITNIFAMIFQCTPVSFFWAGWKGEMSGFCGVDVRLVSVRCLQGTLDPR